MLKILIPIIGSLFLTTPAYSQTNSGVVGPYLKGNEYCISVISIFPVPYNKSQEEYLILLRKTEEKLQNISPRPKTIFAPHSHYNVMLTTEICGEVNDQVE